MTIDGGEELELLAGIQKSIGRLEGMCEAIQKRQDGFTEWMTRHDARLNRIEARVAKNALIFGALGSICIGAVGVFIQQHFFSGK